MALPDSFRLVFVALTAMVVFRFITELSGSQTASTKTSNAVVGESAHRRDESVGMGHEVDTGDEEEAPRKKAVTIEEDTEQLDDDNETMLDGSATGLARLKKHQVLIRYCTSCAYKGTYNQVAMILDTRALETLEVRGAEYPPPEEKVRYAQLVFYIQMLLFGIVFFSEQLLDATKVPAPVVSQILGAMKENKFAVFMFVWLAGNLVQTSLISTGAFEIQKGNKLIWSSLEQKRLPNMNDIVEAFGQDGVEFMQSHRDQES